MTANDAKATQQLFEAAKHGSVDAARAAIAAKANVDAVDNQGRTPLHWAAYNGHVNVAEVLIDKGATINPVVPSDGTPLHYAAFAGQTAMSAFLLAKGADLNARNQLGETALDLAAVNRCAQTVEVLRRVAERQRARAVTAEPSRKEREPIHELMRHTQVPEDSMKPENKMPIQAAIAGDSKDAKGVHNAGANIRTCDDRQSTPLHLVAEQGQPAIAVALIQSGADINAVDSWQRTPLHVAAANGRTEIVRLLLANGASVNARDERHRTPLHWAVHEGHYGASRLLIERGADVHAKDVYERTPLAVASQYNCSDIWHLLKNFVK